MLHRTISLETQRNRISYDFYDIKSCMPFTRGFISPDLTCSKEGKRGYAIR